VLSCLNVRQKVDLRAHACASQVSPPARITETAVDTSASDYFAAADLNYVSVSLRADELDVGPEEDTFRLPTATR
jgi:hypothetical protein